MIGADDVALAAAAAVRQEGMSAVAADIEKGAQFAVVAAHRENPPGAMGDGGVVAGVLQLRNMPGVNPSPPEHPPPRGGEDLRRIIKRPRQPETGSGNGGMIRDGNGGGHWGKF